MNAGEHVHSIPADDLKMIITDWLWEDPKMAGYAKYCTSLRIFWNNSIDTACAGRGYIFFNPDFFKKLPEATRKTIFMHEVWHLILDHLKRYTGKNHDLANIAMDHVINLMLINDGHTFIGFTPYADQKYTGMSFEQVYNDIMGKIRSDPDYTLEASTHLTDDEVDELIKDTIPEDELEDDTLDNLTDFHETNLEDLIISDGKGAGTALRKLTQSSSNTFVFGKTYEEIFADYMVEPEVEEKRTFSRPSRRMRTTKSGLRLAGKKKRLKQQKSLEHLYFALDVSGSITTSQANMFHSAVRTVKELLKPEKMTILFFDTRISYKLVLDKKDEYGEIKVKAGGGTDISCVWQLVKRDEPNAVVMFTDMGFKMLPPPGENTDVIWISPVKRVVQVASYGKSYLIPDMK